MRINNKHDRKNIYTNIKVLFEPCLKALDRYEEWMKRWQDAAAAYELSPTWQRIARDHLETPHWQPEVREACTTQQVSWIRRRRG